MNIKNLKFHSSISFKYILFTYLLLLGVIVLVTLTTYKSKYYFDITAEAFQVDGIQLYYDNDAKGHSEAHSIVLPTIANNTHTYSFTLYNGTYQNFRIRPFAPATGRKLLISSINITDARGKEIKRYTLSEISVLGDVVLQLDNCQLIIHAVENPQDSNVIIWGEVDLPSDYLAFMSDVFSLLGLFSVLFWSLLTFTLFSKHIPIWHKISMEYKYIILLIPFYYVWMIILPFNRAPDEWMRFQVIEDMLKFGRVLVAGDSSGVYPITFGFSYSFLIAHSAYIFGKFLIDVCDLFLQLDHFLIVRHISFLSGILSVLVFNDVLKKIDVSLRENHAYRLTILSLFAMWPQVAFMFTYVNLDAITILLSVVLIWCMLDGSQNNWTYKTMTVIGLSVGFALLSYYNGYGNILALGLFFSIDHIKKRFFPLKKILYASFLAMAIALPYILKNYILYADVFGRSITGFMGRYFAIPAFQPQHNITAYAHLGYSALDFFKNLGVPFFNSTFSSYFACFDYMSLSLPSRFYDVYLVFMLVGIGIVIRCFVIGTKRGVNLSFLLALLLSVFINVILHCYYSIYNDYQPQGRYILPSFSSFILLLIIAGLNVKYKQIGKRYLQMFAIFVGISFLYSIFISFQSYQLTNQALWNAHLFFLFIILMLLLYVAIRYERIRYAFLGFIIISFSFFSYVSNWQNLEIFTIKKLFKIEEKSEKIEVFVMNTLDKQENQYFIKSVEKYIPLTVINRELSSQDTVAIAIGDKYYYPLKSLRVQRQNLIIDKFLIPILGTQEKALMLEIGSIKENQFVINQTIHVQRVENFNDRESTEYYEQHRFDTYVWTESTEMSPILHRLEKVPTGYLLGGFAKKIDCQDYYVHQDLITKQIYYNVNYWDSGFLFKVSEVENIRDKNFLLIAVCEKQKEVFFQKIEIK